MANTALISEPINKRILMYAHGNTNDIINTVMWADQQPEHKSSTKLFAPGLKGATDRETCYNIWKHVKSKVKYLLDERGKQFVKSPAATNHDGFADCKSRSIYMASCLANLGIPYAYRFVSYTGNFPYTHVYVIAKPKNSSWYAMDPDMDNFNQQKPSTYFTDKNMSEIYYIAGAGDTVSGKNKKGKHVNLSPAQLAKLKAHRLSTPDMVLHKHPTDMNEVDMDIAIRRHRNLINKHIIDAIKGVGSPHSEKLKDLEDAYSDAAHIMSADDLEEEHKIAGLGLIAHGYRNGHYDTSQTLASIGDIGKKNTARKAAAPERRATLKAKAKKVGTKIKEKAKKDKGKAKGVFKKIGKGLKKAVKGVSHLAKSLANIPLKILLNTTLPKAADFFIYLFVKKHDLIAKLPVAARGKRKLSEGIAQFLVHAIGLKEDHFMGLIRNGIMKKHHLSPERVLSDSLHMNIAGIGDAGEIGIIDDIVKIIFSVLKEIMKLFKKKAPKELEEGLNAPDAAPNIAADFASADQSIRTELAQAITRQPVAPEELAASDPAFVPPTSGGGASGGGGSGSSADPGEAKDEDPDVHAAETALTSTNSSVNTKNSGACKKKEDE